jgi:anti-sigma factor RsiW
VDNDKNEFDQLERELREALATRAAPDGFSRKVMARIDTRRKSSPAWWPTWRWAAAAAVFAIAILALAASQWQRQREQRIAGERAREQVILALRITGSTLDAVQQKVQRTGKEIHP